jgi:hypothetical protein
MLFLDIETDGLNPTKMHCVWVQHNDGVPVEIKSLHTLDHRLNYLYPKDRIVIHNGLGFDVPQINRLCGKQMIDPKRVIDTFVVSRLVDYKRFRTHSLKEWGEYLGFEKGEYTGDWQEYTYEMSMYCKRDVEVLAKVYQELAPFITNKEWAKAMRVEHDIATICNQMSVDGLAYDYEKALTLQKKIDSAMYVLEQEFEAAFPPVLVEDRRIKMRRKKDGQLMAPVMKAMAEADGMEITGDDIILFRKKPFNPGSTKDRIDVLHAAGWKPVNKTKGHKEYLRGDRG